MSGAKLLDGRPVLLLPFETEGQDVFDAVGRALEAGDAELVHADNVGGLCAADAAALLGVQFVHALDGSGCTEEELLRGCGPMLTPTTNDCSRSPVTSWLAGCTSSRTTRNRDGDGLAMRRSSRWRLGARGVWQMTKVSPVRLVEIFVEVADTLVDEFDLVEFMQVITLKATEVAGATAVGLMLADPHGRLQLLAASDERAEVFELFRVQRDEGPCQDCFRTGVAVVASDLAQEENRWPAFALQATAAGFRSVHAFPLRLRRDVIGALGVFSNATGDLDAEDARVVQVLADVATIGLMQERALQRGTQLTEQLEAALNSRVVIQQARGVLAQLHGITPEEAFVLLQSYARMRRFKLVDVAQTVVADPQAVPNLTEPSRAEPDADFR
ncbi:MAG TPA: GAF and ANTAR domain-containing protein [Nocardioidaceae bacterium]|nr:GAF and ANTAR domain-containing protein [Nocardioidaceae bacterium]